jgi:predicted choloylglycine hydrolase
MCTTAAVNIANQWVLLKTRDPVSWMRWDDEIALFHSPADSVAKWIVQNPDPNQDGYYGGINAHGVALVATYVGVAENQISYIRKPYVRLILEANSASQAVQMIRSFRPRIGGNMFVADAKSCYGIEASPNRYFVERIKTSAVKTNHFIHLPLRNRSFDREVGYEAWSHRHYERATELLATCRSVEDCQALLQDRKYAEQNQAICTTSAEEACYTHSAMVFQTDRKLAHYAQGCPVEVPFKQFGF